MGFVFNTHSDVLGVETRSESAILTDTGDRAVHQMLFLPHIKKATVQSEIVQMIMQEAGKAFAKNDEKKAKELKATADLVKGLKLYEPQEPQSFEVDYVWLAALVDFCTTNNTMIGHLDSVRVPAIEETK